MLGREPAADGGAGAACSPHLSPLQARIYQKAVDGPGAPRDFLYLRRGILQLDFIETAEWASSVSRVRAAGMNKLAEAQPVPSATV